MSSPPAGTSSDKRNTLKELDVLIQESLQIYELENQKTNIIDELFNALKIVTEFLSFSVKVNPSIFNISEDTKVTLTPSLDLLFVYSNGKTAQKRLDNFPPEKITQILEHVMPLILDLINAEKEYLTENITFLRLAIKHLKKLHNLKNGEGIEPPVTVEEG